MSPDLDGPSPQVLAVGKAPGTLVAPPDAIGTRLSVIRFAVGEYEHHKDVGYDAMRKLSTAFDGVVWIDVTGCGTIPVFERLVKDFGIPWLTLEDVLNAPQRPKVEPFADARFVLMRQIQTEGTVEMDQVSVWMSGTTVITFQHRAGDCFDLIRRRLSDATSQLRQRGADYLAYRIVDACVDSFFPEMERIMDALEALEESAVEAPDRKLLVRLHETKRELRVLEKTILPMRDAVGSLTRDDSAFAPETRPYLRDVYDHTNQLVEQMHLLDQLAGDVGDLALGALDVRLNTVMKVLAAVTFVFMPINFITSFYGMNFERMPETKWAWGYPAVILLLVAVGGGITWSLWRRGMTDLDK